MRLRLAIALRAAVASRASDVTQLEQQGAAVARKQTSSVVWTAAQLAGAGLVAFALGLATSHYTLVQDIAPQYPQDSEKNCVSGLRHQLISTW